MGRAATGSVDFHGSPPRWWARVTVKIDPALVPPGGKRTKREWIDLERPDIPNTPEGKERARVLARRAAKVAKTHVHVGISEAARPAVAGVTLSELADTWFAHIERNPD